jgi:hypothetical protein
MRVLNAIDATKIDAIHLARMRLSVENDNAK